jgi:ferredoxin/coenzyme F420-reducing hydrogenase delta subunit
MRPLQSALRKLLERLSDLFEHAFGPAANPLNQLGALGWFFFWIVAASGIYLYVFFDTGVTQAYESVEALTHEQWWAGGIMRSLHRYASDALVVVALLHLLREFAFDRLHGPRVFGWLTGLVLLGFIYVCGLTGYWLVWDQLAQYVAIVTSEWLDALPIFAGSIARNFLHSGAVSGRFFTLMVYVHIAAPLLMLFVMWLHIQRHAQARVNPAKPLAIGTLAALLALSVVFPAVSQGAADLDRAPARLALDWFYLAVHPAVERLGGVTMWLLVAGAGLLLALLAWRPRKSQRPVAVVHLAECNGCGRCVDDCPFTAISLEPRSDGRPFAREAVVDADRCVGCGICAGACPTATPFRRATALVPGIELPDHAVSALRARTLDAGARLAAASPADSPRVIVYRCAHGAVVPPGRAEVIDVPCVGMIPPPFLDFVLTRSVADGVMLAGCREEACRERLGGRWTEARVAGERDPRLRERIDRERVCVSRAGITQSGQRRSDLDAFFAHLRSPRASSCARRSAWRAPLRARFAALRFPARAGWYAAFATILGVFSVAPAHEPLAPDQAVVRLSFTHAARLRQPCRPLTPEELASLPVNMRRPRDCPRGRWPVVLELWVDGRPVHVGVHEPAGLWDDGASTVYRRFAVPAGEKTLMARLRDSGRSEGFDYERSFEVRLEPRASLVVDFDEAAGGFVLHGAYTRHGGSP